MDTATIIAELTIGQRIGCYEVVALEAGRVAIADHSATLGKTYNPSRRWYSLTSPTLAARIARQIAEAA